MPFRSSEALWTWLPSGMYHYKKYLTPKMEKLRITAVKSTIDRPAKQKATVRALGLRRMNHSVEVEATPQILGMIDKVKHLLKVEKI